MFNFIVKAYDNIMKKFNAYYYEQNVDYQDGDIVISRFKPRRQLMSSNCGMVMLSSILNLLRKSDKRMIKDLKDEDDGITAGQMLKQLNKSKISFNKKYSLSFVGVKKMIDGGHPIITSLIHNGVGHWACIYGYSDNKIIISGCSKSRYGWKEFKRSKGGSGLSVEIIV